MRGIRNVVLLGFVFMVSCGDKNNESSNSGQVTISSEFLGNTVYYVNGFSFEDEKFVPSMNSGGGVPDIIPENILQKDGEVIGMAFSAGQGNNYGFYKNYENTDIDQAEEFYKQYLNVNVNGFSGLTDTLVPGQVYTFRTLKDNYVKFVIKELKKKSGEFSDYFEAEIKYKIQRDGTEIFGE